MLETPFFEILIKEIYKYLSVSLSTLLASFGSNILTNILFTYLQSS